MNTEYRYAFEKGSKKYLCPECNRRRFVRYIDREADKYLPEEYGRCDREINCGYFLNPYENGYSKMIWKKENNHITDWKPQIQKPIAKPTRERFFIPVEVFKRTLSGYEHNVFIQNLLSKVSFPFEINDVEKVVSLYQLGTIQKGYRAGAVTFPFIDSKKNVRAVQLKQFDETNNTTGTDFLHSIIEKFHSKRNKPLPQWIEAYKKNELKVSCLFGCHLLSQYPYNPIALVEAPKSAIYGALYFGFPEQPTNFIWMAVYNLSSLNLEKCKVLKGRNVYLFPDLSKDGKAFELWSKKAAEIQKQLSGTYFHVSDLLEQLAPTHDKVEGKDIADYLIQQDWRQFRNQECEKGEKSEGQKETLFSQYIESLTLEDGVWLSPQGYPLTWDLFGNDANEETKEFIRRIEQNPQLIQK
ncbi:MAG: hypothetical protein ACI9YE_000827 [Psychroserpens sp.]|jgi:hypothetical protein